MPHHEVINHFRDGQHEVQHFEATVFVRETDEEERIKEEALAIELCKWRYGSERVLNRVGGKPWEFYTGKISKVAQGISGCPLLADVPVLQVPVLNVPVETHHKHDGDDGEAHDQQPGEEECDARAGDATVSPPEEIPNRPAFWENNRQAWFNHVERLFCKNRMTDDDLKYSNVVAVLGSETVAEVADFIANPLAPAGCKYEELKLRLLANAARR